MILFKKKNKDIAPIVNTEIKKEDAPPEIINENRQQKSVRQEINDLKDMFNNPEKIKQMVEQSKQYQRFLKKQKNFKLPGKVMREAKKAYKKSKILIVLLKIDRSIQFIIGQIVNGMVFIGDTPHQASIDFTFIYNGVPVLVIPEWSLQPIGTKDYYQALENKTTTEAGTIIIRAIEAKENQMLEKKAPGKIIIWLLIGGAVLFAFFFFSKKK